MSEPPTKKAKVEKPPARCPKRKYWVFTWFGTTEGMGFTEDEPSDDWMLITRYFSMHATHASMQEETTKDGKHHLQGFVAFKKGTRFKETKELQAIKWCNASLASELSNKNYTTKSDSAVPGGIWWSKGFAKLTCIKGYSELYEWQREIWDMVKQPCLDDRTVYWYYDQKGGNGKTALIKSLMHHMDAFYFEGKTSDIGNRILALRHKPTICVMNLRRTQEGHVNYNAIEALKDGLISSGKYEGGACIWDPPHLVVMANFCPKLEGVTKERWVVRKLDDGKYTTLSEEDIVRYHNHGEPIQGMAGTSTEGYGNGSGNPSRLYF